MFNRKFVLPVMLATAVGAPYLFTSEDGPSALTQQITGLFSGSGTGDASSDAPWTATGTSRDVRSEYGCSTLETHISVARNGVFAAEERSAHAPRHAVIHAHFALAHDLF